MDLAAQLGRLRSVEDLSGLLAGLGHEPLFEPVPMLITRRPNRATAPVFAVARVGEFPWFGLAGPAPERLAQRLARRLASRGRVAGVLGIDPVARRLAIALALDGVPTLELELDAPAAAAVASVARLAGSNADAALAYAARVADALSGEEVGRRFFREFKVTLELMTDALPASLRPDDRRNLALLQLTRVLFLYFIQAKGWLAGRARFLSEEIDRCLTRGRRIHRDLLRPLFFGTLNRPPSDRSRWAKSFGAIPFLNGGLFEPNALERHLRRDIPNNVWRDAFDRLFERFHFVVSEPHGGSIAPDMLGRVFEGVMAPDLRRASGTYYTPAGLVRLVLDAALVALTAGRLGCGEGQAERRLRDPDPAVKSLLSGVSLLDPAVGSGAFLLGALERLSTLIARNGQPTTAELRAVLRRNVFGVDRSAAAVRLTELRLWLAVIAGDHEDRPARVEPLPNLDCLVRQGDSLFEPASAARLRAADPALADAVASLRGRLVTATGPIKQELARALRVAECRAAAMAVQAGEAEARSRIDECLLMARTQNLFGERRGVDQDLRSRLDAARADLRSLRAVRRTLVREREVPWFHFQSHFADVFAAGGFDILAGNPPWLRAEEIPAETRRGLTGRYRWWRRSGTTYGNQPDLAVAFLERAVELTAPGGIVAMLVPAKLATAGYAVTARHGLAASMTLTHVADLTGRPDAAFEATVYPLALVARKSCAPAGHRVRVTLGPGRAGSIPQSTLRGGSPWLLVAHRAHAVLARLAREHPCLRERFTCQLGVKTGANGVFLDPTPEVEPELLRWAIRGRDVRPFTARPRVRLLWTHGIDGAPLVSLPPRAAEHVRAHEKALRARADYAGGPPWTLFRTHAAASAHRVVWSDMARTLTACCLSGRADERRIPLNTCYVTPTETADAAERLAAWLNSTWIRAVALTGAVPAASGFHRFTATTVGRIPLPAIVLADAELSGIAESGRRGEAVQEALDDIAARHLGLTRVERHALEGLVGRGAADRR